MGVLSWLQRRKLNGEISKKRLVLEERGLELEKRLLEAAAITTSYVDPIDALRDPETGEIWDALGLQGSDRFKLGPTTEQQLAEVRSQCRHLAITNEFAVNGHENRISYIVGSGHSYSVAAKPGEEIDESEIRPVQDVLDEFIEANLWRHRQQEIVRRMDRDGECFLRFFEPKPGAVRIRFVEPDEVATPIGDTRPNATFGIVTEPDDVETVLAYLIDGRQVPAEEIQHRKANVDTNVKRGLPLYYPVRTNLDRTQKLLRNMSVVAGIQSAIALIRKHQTGTKSTYQQFRADEADATVSNTSTGKTYYYDRYQPGMIIDASAGTDYEFPVAGIDATRFVAILQAELRAIASRLVMPEFMLSSDASNANYSSTMVAEGPAVKMFQRLQWTMIDQDRAVMNRVLDRAVAAGRIEGGLRDAIVLVVEPPRVEARNRREEVEADMSLVEHRIMSKHTAQLRHDLDPESEQNRIEVEREKTDPFGGTVFAGPGDSSDKNGQDDEAG